MSVGAWAADYSLSTDTWFENVSEKTQNVLKICLCKEGGGALQSAIDAFTAYGWSINDKTLSDFKIVYIDLGETDGQPNDTFAMNDADIAALSNLNFETIDLQDVYYMKNGEKSAFTFTNSYVQNLILPDNWTKEEVNNCAKGVGTSLGAALSQCPINENSATVYAYVCTSGTLVNTTDHVWFDGKTNSKIGDLTRYSQSFKKVKNLSVSGYGSARDFSGVYGGLEYDPNGHFIFDKPADETSDSHNAAVGGGTRTLIGGTEKLTGAFYGAVLETLDLESLILEDEYNDDLNLSYGGLVGNTTKRVIIPTYAGLKTLPADFLNVDGNQVCQICIPGNIKTIRTRAFMSTPLYHVWTTVGDNDPVVINGEGHDATVYDNGVWLKDASEGKTGYQDISLTSSDYWYGTFTLPAGLELIESRAFGNTNAHIKDVYSLNINAPECHVDAFSISGYIANNSMNGKPVDGIITRDAYAKDVAAGTWITMLHYPRESTTPDIQRYTDVTRKYSIATGLRDGKGATIYFPTQTEFNRAYLQGTFGYLWNAWDPTRYDNNEVSYLDISELAQYSRSLQQKANQGYLDNNANGIVKNDRSFYDVTDLNSLDQPSGLKYYYETYWEGKQLYPEAVTTGTDTYRTTEDLDANGNKQYEENTSGDYIKVGTYTAENGTLDPNTTYYVRDVEGTGKYEDTTTPNGSTKYYSDAEGKNEVTPLVGNGFYVECGTQNVYSDAVYAPVEGVDTYYTKNGDEYTESYIYFDGNNSPRYYNPVTETVPNYVSTNVLVNNIDTYYSDENGTVVTPTFDKTYYHSPVTTTESKPKYQVVHTWETVGYHDSFYILNNGEYQLTTPTFNNTNATYYYLDSDDEYRVATTFIDGVETYYIYGWNNNVQGYYESNVQLTQEVYYIDGTEDVTTTTYSSTTTPVSGVTEYYTLNNTQYTLAETVSLNGTYYYQDGTKEVTKYSSSEYWIPEVETWYALEWVDGVQQYVEKTQNYYQGTYYYVTGTAPKYCSAESEEYNEAVTYYTDNTGTTEATSVTFATTYYYETTTYSYTAATDDDADKTHYYVAESYVNKETELNVPDEYRCDENYYSVKTKQVEILSLTKANDYRGWHQFVLTSYATNSNVPFVPYRSYITDNDWWTICLPFDLTRAELIKMFGTENGAQLPYLSKLTYVVRDVENKDITLNFSKNLLVYKEELVGDSELHGKVSDTENSVNDDDIVLHKGVPYLIRPFLTKNEDGNYNRQFDILSTGVEGDLYDRIQTSHELSGSELNQIIYNGEYTVPAYVINNTNSAEGVHDSESVKFTMGDNTEFDYANNTKITYNGEDVEAQISSDYCYTFVGSFFLSLMPKYSYFLGWDSTKNRAAFWYNAVPNPNEWTWNNETGIILPNFVTAEQEIKITAAEDLNNPARWVINLEKGDDFPKTSSVKNHVTAMDFGSSSKLFDGDATVIIKVDNDVIDPSSIHFNNKGVYSLSGQYMGNSVEGLQKGIYVVNGKKMVIK